MGVEIGDESGESDEAARLRCPYCGHEDTPSEMHTEATVAYLKRFVNREIVIPQLNKFSAGLEDLVGGGQSGGFLSISWKSTRTILPPRPIHGPEPPDFKIIDFLCCSKKIKLADTCTAIEACTYCGTPVGVLA